MKSFAPILWIIFGIAAVVYWSNSTDRAPVPRAHADSDDGSGSAGEFGGYDCTVDCSGHEAGYAWAEEHDITDEDECGGKSESFIEGCKAYVHDQGMGIDDDSDRDDE